MVSTQCLRLSAVCTLQTTVHRSKQKDKGETRKRNPQLNPQFPTASTERSGEHEAGRRVLPPPSSSLEDLPGSRVPGATSLEAPSASPSAAGLHVPALRPWLQVGESADRLASGRPRARSQRRALPRGEGGGVAGRDALGGAVREPERRGAPCAGAAGRRRAR
jgi:hypothetical protein